jgi:hypothetical protein
MERIMWSVSRYVYKPLLEPFFRTRSPSGVHRSPSGVLPHLDTFAHHNFVVFTINPARKHTFDKHFDKLSDHSVQRSMTGSRNLSVRGRTGRGVRLPFLHSP